MEQPDFKHIAAQLRHPSGTDGLETAERMSVNNGHMIQTAMDHLPLKDGDAVLEIGPGGGLHVPYLLGKADDLHYNGADISETMVTLAKQHNAAAVSTGHATFIKVETEDGCAKLPFADGFFNIAFTVNTLYFWDDAQAQATEIMRVLKPGGVLALCFAAESFMRQLPFTQYGFHLYSSEKAAALLQAAGFTVKDIHTEKEIVTSPSGDKVEREFIVMMAEKV